MQIVDTLIMNDGLTICINSKHYGELNNSGVSIKEKNTNRLIKDIPQQKIKKVVFIEEKT